MKGIKNVMRMRRVLSRIARDLGLGYECRVEIFDYEPGGISEGFMYPETLELRIESHQTHHYSLRLRDGRFVKYGAPVNTAKGQTAFRVSRFIIRELKAHAAKIKGGAR